MPGPGFGGSILNVASDAIAPFPGTQGQDTGAADHTRMLTQTCWEFAVAGQASLTGFVVGIVTVTVPSVPARVRAKPFVVLVIAFTTAVLLVAVQSGIVTAKRPASRTI